MASTVQVDIVSGAGWPGDDPVGEGVAEIVPDPVGERFQPVAETGDTHQVQSHPKKPRKEALGVEERQVGHCFMTAYGGQGAKVEVPEFPGRFFFDAVQ